MKPKIKYLRGCIEIETNNDLGYINVLKKNKLVTRHPTISDRFFFFKNHIGSQMFIQYKQFFLKYWDVEQQVIDELEGFTDYTCSHEPIPIVDIPGVTLKDYQKKSVEYMLSNKKFCIFLGQGTGKTYITITALRSIIAKEGKKKILIVTPKKVIEQYKEDTDKYVDSDVTVINYESLHKIKGPFDIVCFDESHLLKNSSSNMNKHAVRLSADRTYLFTGSPQDKNKHEVLAQLRVLHSWLYPAKYKVNERYFVLDDYGNPIKEKPGTEIDEIITSCSYGDKTDSLLDLPLAHHHIVECTIKDKTFYDTLKNKSVAEVNGDKILVDSPAVLRLRLRQICNGYISFEKFDEDTQLIVPVMHRLENPKEEPFRNLVSNLDTSVIYTQFDYDIKEVSKILDSLGRTYVVVNGKTKEAAPLFKKFKDKEADFLVIQAKSGNAGLNFQHTNNMIFYSLPESFIVFDQCLHRIRRIGQELDCNYYYLITKGTVEVALHRSLKNKKSFSSKMFELYRKEE